jgi:hypothetical protein
VTLPNWYLDGEVHPGQSRRVDLAYARTDMRAQGLTRQRALLSLDGCEDTEGLYVQLSRARERTDLYLSVTPEPPLAGQERAYPQSEPTDAEAVLARVLERDGAKQLASDEQHQGLSAQALRRLSTRQLRNLRDRLDQERTDCPPDRAAAARRAAEQATADEQARQDAEAARDAAEHPAGRVAWRQAAVALDGYRRLWGLADPGPAQHRGPRGERATAGGAADRRGRVGPAAALPGREPRGDLGQRRDWRAAHAALQRLDRAREQRPEREDRTRRVGRDRDDERAIS